jgi:hypothetical protein
VDGDGLIADAVAFLAFRREVEGFVCQQTRKGKGRKRKGPRGVTEGMREGSIIQTSDEAADDPRAVAAEIDGKRVIALDLRLRIRTRR